MIDRTQVETLLRIHGVSPTSPDEEIRSILLSAKYDNDEVDGALMVLRENTETHASRIDGLHKIYRTDRGLLPHEVSALLGIEVEVNNLEVRNHRVRTATGSQNFVVLALALFLAVGGLMYAMYSHGSGPFHPTVTAFNK